VNNSQFLSKLILVASDDADGRWHVFAPLVYYSEVAARVITVPAGFPTDLASTPRIPIFYEAFGNVGAYAAVVHDYLYTSGRESRAVADAVMREAMEVSGISWWKRWGMYLGVRIGGARAYTRTPAGSPTV
jgi:hypothetical protein